jgi:hypothetical protein
MRDAMFSRNYIESLPELPEGVPFPVDSSFSFYLPSVYSANGWNPMSCRDSFQGYLHYFRSGKFKAFFITTNNPGRIKVVSDIEAKLKLKNPAVIYCTTNQHTFCIEPGEFWRGSSMRWSVLSYLLKYRVWPFGKKRKFINRFASGCVNTRYHYNDRCGFVSNLRMHDLEQLIGD